MTGFYAGELVPAVQVFGQTVDVWAHPVPDESGRRADRGIGPILDPELLQMLMRVPADVAVRLASLDPVVQLVLADAGVDAGAVRIVGADVVREAVPPVALVGLVKYVHCWADIQATTLLRTYAPRLVVTDSQRLAQRAVQTTDPDLGVVHRVGAHERVLRMPGRRWLCPSWQRWLLAETAFALTLDRGPWDGGIYPTQQT